MMASATALQLGAGYRFKGVSRHKRANIAASLRGNSEGLQAVQYLANSVPDGGDVVTGTALNDSGRVSANSLNVHSDTSSSMDSTYRSELDMSFIEQRKKFRPAMHLAGNLKVPLADALRRATKRMRNAAKSIAQATQRHERTAKNWLSADTEMSATELVRLMREFDEVADLVLSAAGLGSDLTKLRALKALLEE